MKKAPDPIELKPGSYWIAETRVWCALVELVYYHKRNCYVEPLLVIKDHTSNRTVEQCHKNGVKLKGDGVVGSLSCLMECTPRALRKLTAEESGKYLKYFI